MVEEEGLETQAVKLTLPIIIKQRDAQLPLALHPLHRRCCGFCIFPVFASQPSELKCSDVRMMCRQLDKHSKCSVFSFVTGSLRSLHLLAIKGPTSLSHHAIFSKGIMPT